MSGANGATLMSLARIGGECHESLFAASQERISRRLASRLAVTDDFPQLFRWACGPRNAMRIVRARFFDPG